MNPSLAVDETTKSDLEGIAPPRSYWGIARFRVRMPL